MGTVAKVVIAGGTGFVGRHVVAALQGRGARVVVVGRSPDAARARLGVEAVGWRDASGLAAAVTGAAAVLSFVGEPVLGRWTRRKKAAIRASRVETTQALVDVVASAPAGARPAVFVSASAVGYYGLRAGREDAPVDETAPPGDDPLARICVAWEAAADEARALGVRVVRLRLGVVLGDGGFVAQVRPVARLGLFGPLGSGRQGFPWVSVEDVCGVVLRTLDDPDMDGAVNVTGPALCDQRRVVRAIGATLGRPTFLRVPAVAVRALFGEGANVALADTWVRPVRLERARHPFVHPTPEAAVAAALGRGRAPLSAGGPER